MGGGKQTVLLIPCGSVISLAIITTHQSCNTQLLYGREAYVAQSGSRILSLLTP